MTLTSQIRHIVRRFGRAPSFTFIASLTLALGIGATTAMYAVVDGVLLEPLPYPESVRLVGIWHEAPGLGNRTLDQAPAAHLTYRAEGRVFEDVAMWVDTRVTITGVGEPEQAAALRITEGALELLQVRPLLGRSFTADDDRPGAPLTALLGWGWWQERKGGDPGILGSTIEIDGRTHEIIGVLPRGFRFIEHDAAVVLPFQVDPAYVALGDFSYFGLGRLRPGATIAQANADLARMIPITAATYERPGGLSLAMLQEAKFGPSVRPLMSHVIGDVAGVLWVLFGTVGIVLLIACANVANLFLVRAEARYRELAVRTALGASRARIVLDSVMEGVGLGLFAGAIGVALAFAGLQVLQKLAPAGLPRLSQISIDPSVLLVATLISLFAGVVLGLIPVSRHGRQQLSAALREGGRGGSAGRERHRVRSVLVVSQLALALVLLTGSGLMLRSALALRAVDPGFERPEEVLTLRLTIPEATAATFEDAAAMHERVLRAVMEVPGVAAAGLSSSNPMDGFTSMDPLFVEDFPLPENSLAPIRTYKWVSPGYFGTMENRLLAGRDLTWDDVHQMRPVVIVTENFAREYWGSAAAAIGKRVRNAPGRTWREIVGVVADTRDKGVDRAAPGIAYWPMLMSGLWNDGPLARRSMAYALRLDRPLTAALMGEMRRAVWSVGPDLPLYEVQTLDRILARSMARTSFTLVMLGIAAGVALLLGAVGLYGVISYIVAQRTREFGVRMALGARAGDVGRMVVREASLLVVIGLALGLVAAGALTRLMSALLFGVAPLDPLTFGAVAVLLGVVALMAAWLPARRAAGVDPIEALRWE